MRIKRIAVLLFALWCAIGPSVAQVPGIFISSPAIPAVGQSVTDPFFGWTGQPTVTGAPGDATYLVYPSLNPDLTNERLLAVSSPLAIADGGAGGSATISLNTVPLNKGGTGATTQQGAVNAILGFSGITAGDIAYYNGTNWVRLGIDSDGKVLTLSSGLPSWQASASGAPANAEYVVISLNGSLTDERTLAVSSDLTLTDGGAGAAATLGVNTTVTKNSASQTLTNKTLTSPIIGTSLILDNGSNDITLTWASSAARAHLIPDVADASFVMTEGSQTVNGLKTYSDLKLSGTTFKTASNTITVPAADDTLVNLGSTQTLTAKTATSLVLQTDFQLKSTANYTFIWDSTSSARQIEIKNVGGDSRMVLGVSNLAYTAGGIAYGNANTLQITSAGSSGQPLISAGTSAPGFNDLGAAHGGTGATTVPAKGSILVGNSGGTAYANLAVGSNGQALLADSAQTNGVKWGAVSATLWGGNGADGSATITTSSDSGPQQKNYTSATVSSSNTLTITESPYIIQATGTITVNGTITCTAGGGLGGRGATVTQVGSDSGGGPGGAPGQPGNPSDTGGGGGANGGRGGRGGRKSTSTNSGPAGNAHQFWLNGGSGGAGGGAPTTNAGGAGGRGGTGLGLFAIGAILISSTGTITCSGAAGAGGTSDSSGGGGGSGGTVVAASQTSVTLQASGVVTCSGGAGGAGAGGTGGDGGGGGHGKFIAWSPSNTISGTVTLGGGAAGGANAEAGAGSGSTTTITGTPNLPLIAYVHTEEGASYVECAEMMTKATGKVKNNIVDISHRGIVASYAHGDMVKYAKALSHDANAEATCLGDNSEALANAA